MLKGARAIIWDRLDDGHRHFERAFRLGACVDNTFLSTLTHKLLDYEMEFGVVAVQDILNALISILRTLSGEASVRSLMGSYLVNHAFRDYKVGDYANAKRKVVLAIGNNPKYLVNRGVLAILGRSTLKTIFRS